MGDSVADTIRLPWTLAVRRADEASAPDDHAATGKKTSARRGRFSRLFRSEQSQAKLALPDQLIRNTLDAMGCEDIDLTVRRTTFPAVRRLASASRGRC